MDYKGWTITKIADTGYKFEVSRPDGTIYDKFRYDTDAMVAIDRVIELAKYGDNAMTVKDAREALCMKISAAFDGNFPCICGHNETARYLNALDKEKLLRVLAAIQNVCAGEAEQVD